MAPKSTLQKENNEVFVRYKHHTSVASRPQGSRLPSLWGGVSSKRGRTTAAPQTPAATAALTVC